MFGSAKWFEIPIPSNGKSYEVCITGVQVRAYDHVDCGENEAESPVAWIYFDAGTVHCSAIVDPDPTPEDEQFADDVEANCLTNPNGLDCKSEEDMCYIAGCSDESDACAIGGTFNCP